MQTLEEKQQDGMTGAGPETEFHTELFGFNRVEVLSYIERISAANAEKRGRWRTPSPRSKKT